MPDRLLLSDFTFLIPIRIDSTDRYENLQTMIEYFNHYLQVNILILEADDFQHIDPEQFPENVGFFFIKDSNTKFHRTHYLNELLKKATTPYVGIWDVDVLVPVAQLYEGLQLLRQNKSFFVLPYDGRCYSLDIEAKQKLRNTKLLNVENGTLYAEHACGGALIANKRVFMKVGMCNEYLGSWGPDDVEQKKRLEILGYPYTVMIGPLFHLEHVRCVNSSYQDDKERLKLVEEYIRIASLNRKELYNYVKSWSWISEVVVEDKNIIEIPEKELYDFLIRLESTSSGELSDWMIGWFYLGLRGKYPEYRSRIQRGLSSVIRKMDGGCITGPEYLSEIGFMLLFLLKNNLCPATLNDRLAAIDTLMFKILYKQRLQTFGLRNSVWQVVLYYFELLRSPRNYKVYESVYYKEYLIYVIDEAKRLLDVSIQEKNRYSVVMFLKKKQKDLACWLWLCSLMEEVELNQVVLLELRNKISDYIYYYFSFTSDRKVEDIWLLYVWYKFSRRNFQDELAFVQWFTVWKQAGIIERISVAENYLYGECCRFCGEHPLVYSTSGKIEDAIDIFMLQTNILNK